MKRATRWTSRAGLSFFLFISVVAGASEKNGVKPMDGVIIDAVETYQNPKSQQADFGLGVWPLNPYYMGFSLDAGYTYYYNKTYSWEVLHADYIYTVDSGLTSQLAENYGVNPEQIDRLNLLISTNLQYAHAYGKFIFLKEYIRYFRASFLGGPAFLVTNKEATVGLGVGYRLETFVNDKFSWKLEARDVYAFGSIGNTLAFIFGTSYGF